MTKNLSIYIEKLNESVFKIISEEINDRTIHKIVKDDLYDGHIKNIRSLNFQNYYFKSLQNETFYFNTTDFFRQFKSQYSLQGIDNSFLDGLERRKTEIINKISSDKLVDLYFSTFNKAKLKYRGTYRERNLGSFFTKLVHTFRPSDYCALDNPIKNYFGLEKESFFISFFIVSDVYKKWSKDNSQIVDQIRTGFQQLDTNNMVQHSKITEIKLLDLIFWTKADRLKRQKAIG